MWSFSPAAVLHFSSCVSSHSGCICILSRLCRGLTDTCTKLHSHLLQVVISFLTCFFNNILPSPVICLRYSWVRNICRSVQGSVGPSLPCTASAVPPSIVNICSSFFSLRIPFLFSFIALLCYNAMAHFLAVKIVLFLIGHGMTCCLQNLKFDC